MEISVLPFATRETVMLKNYCLSLQKYGYSYYIVGLGEKWEGLISKINGWLNHLKTLDNNKLVVLTDAYDVLVCSSPKKLLKRFLDMNSPLVIGAEKVCVTHCEPVDNYWKKKGVKDIPSHRYVNSGFWMGYVSAVKEALLYIAALGIEDDQKGLCRYVNAYPEKVLLDSEQKLVANVSFTEFPFFSIRGKKIYNSIKDSYPIVIHTPGKEGDFLIRTNYFGRKILGDEYISTPLKDILKETILRIPRLSSSTIFLIFLGSILSLALLPLSIIPLLIFVGVIYYYSKGFTCLEF